MIASGCKFIDHDHGFSSRYIPVNVQTDGTEGEIVLEDNVWLGVNVVVLKGLKIERVAIDAGVPARIISKRNANLDYINNYTRHFLMLVGKKYKRTKVNFELKI